jgi:hypothetical protein
LTATLFPVPAGEESVTTKAASVPRETVASGPATVTRGRD